LILEMILMSQFLLVNQTHNTQNIYSWYKDAFWSIGSQVDNTKYRSRELH